jgi:hypothetical protein
MIGRDFTATVRALDENCQPEKPSNSLILYTVGFGSRQNIYKAVHDLLWQYPLKFPEALIVSHNPNGRNS